MEAATDGSPSKNSAERVTPSDGRVATSKPQSKISVKQSDTSSIDTQLSPPDDRYGWVVVGASFVAHMIGDGCCFSFGVVFTELLEYFNQGRSKTAWVGSLFVSMPMICGPIASSCTNRFGCRKTTMVGGVIAAVGCFASAFVNSIEMLCLTFGLISGFGLALVFVPSIVVVAFYFEKQRAFATGIAVAGSGIGTFIFAPLTDFLMDKYSWQGAFIILSAILLNTTICGALFRPLVWQKRSFKSKSTGHTPNPNSNVSISYLDRTNLVPQPQFIFKAYLDNGHCIYYETATNSVIEFPTHMQEEFDSITVQLTADLQHGDKTLREVLAERNLLHKVQVSSGIIPTRETVAEMDLNRKDDASKFEGCNSGTGTQMTSVPQSVSCPSSPQIAHPASVSVVTPPARSDLTREPRNMRHITSLPSPRSRDSRQDRFRLTRRKDVFYKGSLMRTGFMVNSEYSASCPDLYLNVGRRRGETGTTQGEGSTGRGFWRNFRRVMDLSIFRSVIFNFFCVHCFFLYLTYDVPYIYIPDKATSSSAATTDREASFLISIIGISSTVGQIVMGFLGDRPEINTLHFYNAMTSVAGIVTLMVPLLSSFPLLAVYCTAYGFFISANYVLTTIILLDLLGMERLINAFGFVSLFEGLANLIGPPFAGLLYDATGSYSTTFYVSGAIIWMSGSMLFIIPCLQRFEPQQTQSSSQTRSSPEQEPPSKAASVIAGVETSGSAVPTEFRPNGEINKSTSLSMVSASIT